MAYYSGVRSSHGLTCDAWNSSSHVALLQYDEEKLYFLFSNLNSLKTHLNMLKDFRDFAMKGNMMDMAIGFILGAAFGTVVRSLTNDILMPVVSSIFGTPDFSNLFIILRSPENTADVNMESIAAVREAGGVALGYGLFINALIAFILVAFVLWIIVRGMNRLKKKEEEAPAPEPAGPTAEELLTEIRDALKAQQG